MKEDLIDAVTRGDEDRVRLILSSNEDLADTRVNDIPLALLAIFHGHRGVAQTLIDYGATVDVFIASAMNKADRLAMALQGDSSRVNTWSSDGWTPLGLAAFFGADAAARLLIACGADVNARSRNETGNTPLHAAVAGKRPDLVEILVESGVDINSRDAGGWTPLNLAAHEGPVRIIEYLLEHGADPGIPNRNGQTPLETAEREGRGAAADVLRAAAMR